MGILKIGDNQEIFYQRIEGNPELPHLIFLHDGLGCAAMWKGYHERLCLKTGCPGLIYDRQGYGNSSALASDRTIHYLHEYALVELRYVVNTLLPGDPFILVGHSDGGSISLIYGAEKPDRLVGLITEAAHVFVDATTLAGIKATDSAYARGELDGLTKYHGRKTQQIYDAWSDTWQSPWFKHWNIEYALPSIQCPVLVIQGNDDEYGTLEQVDSIVSKSGGRSEKAMIENCGHAPHLQQPAITLDIMSRFIESLVG